MEAKKIVNREWTSKAERGAKSMKPIHAYEQLEKIEKATGQEKNELMLKFGSGSPLNFILSMNFRSDIVLDLPEGMPPLEANELDNATHPDMMGTLATSIHRLKNCVKENKTIKQFKKEDIFIQVLLSCPLKDAEILCSAKDKSLVELYPSITKDYVQSIFPSYVK